MKNWGDRRGLNPRQLEPQSRAFARIIELFGIIQRGTSLGKPRWRESNRAGSGNTDALTGESSNHRLPWTYPVGVPRVTCGGAS